MKKKIDLKIESLRGYCAFIVLVHHLIYFGSSITPKLHLNNYIGGFTFPGHLMVLVFFMLSGYVIGLTYKGKPNFDSLIYLKKRLIRLYPIYLFAILITIVFFHEIKTSIVSTVFFLQNITSANLVQNPPLWSLNHEFIYYLLAIPILKFDINIKYVFALFASLLLISVCIYPFPVIIEGYLVGFIFWMTGFAVSSFKKASSSYQVSSDTSTKVDNVFLSVLLFLLGCDTLSFFSSLFEAIPVSHAKSRFNLDFLVSFSDFSMYLYCLLAIIIAAFTVNKKIRLFAISMYATCWGTILYWGITGFINGKHFFYIPLLFLLLSTIIFFIKRPILNSYKPLAYLGSISYAVYVLHTPVIFLVSKFEISRNPFFDYGVKSLLVILIVIIISYLLEKKLQPKISSILNPSK